MDTLSWKKHNEEICKKLSQLCYIIGQLRNTMDKKSLISYYYAYGESAIRYGITIWATNSNHNRILTLQKRIIRKIFRLGYNESVRETFRKEGIQTIYGLYYLESLQYIHKNLDKLQHNSDNHKYNTRTSNQITIPRHKTAFYERTSKYNGIKYHNNLTNQTKALDLTKLKIKTIEKITYLAPYNFQELDNIKF
uniref:Reverse transcriptase domain-containing protein n=1 Tax=Cacopsylla melanoneura TaxID=428564 RepID=A0A8D8XRU6_9HEMI